MSITDEPIMVNGKPLTGDEIESQFGAVADENYYDSLRKYRRNRVVPLDERSPQGNVDSRPHRRSKGK